MSKQPPHSLEAEQSVIGSVLLSAGVLDDVGFLSADDFYRADHGRIWQTMLTMAASGEVVDLATVYARMGNDRAILGYLSDLARNTPSAANARAYAQIVQERATLRRLIAACIEVENEAMNATEPAAVITAAVGRFDALAQYATRDRRLTHIGSALKGWASEMQDRISNPGLRGHKTGYSALDARWQGVRSGDLLIIAGRPSMGKTTLAMNIGEEVAKTANVLVFSMEMSTAQLIDKTCASLGRIPLRDIRSGQLDGDGYDRLATFTHLASGLNLWIDDTPAQTTDALRLRARAHKSRYGLGLVIVDYLQLAKTTKRHKSRNEEVGDISQSLKAMAKELDVPVIALCQMNRDIEKSSRKPVMSDLRDSGAIEQDADIITFVHVEDKANDWAELVTAKHRNGEVGSDYIGRNMAMSRFEELPEYWQPPEPEERKGAKGGFK